MTMPSDLRRRIDALTYAPEAEALTDLRATADLSPEARKAISDKAARLVRDIRGSTRPGLMEVFLAEYGLSTEEGIALMCLAEALLRVPDAHTIDALIEDKIAPSDWSRHIGHSASPLVNASTWALVLTGKVLDDDARPGPAGHLRNAMKRLGEPVIRKAVARAMKEMGSQFVLGETIEAAMKRGAKMEEKGYTYSYDMLGEAARTESDAARYHLAYSRAITAISKAATHKETRRNPGISVKLSALYARYDELQHDEAVAALVPRLTALCGLAKSARIGLNVDAEEADRLSISLDIIEKTLADPALKGWDGFGVVVQAYGQRAGAVIDWLNATAERLNRRIMVRLVKGAYWDSEIKKAQVMGLGAFPVFTAKSHTDVSYIANARKLLSMTDRIYPQFATHNAHTAAAILHMAREVPKDAFEFQRLHGMGETLHGLLKDQNGTACRIYAPVGAHRDLLAYLVRRLLENGANSSFVNQIVDEEVAPEMVAADPFDAPDARHLPTGRDLFDGRENSKGWDLRHRPTMEAIDAARAPFAKHQWQGGPLTTATGESTAAETRVAPSDPSDTVGTVAWATPELSRAAAAAARPWSAPASERARVLNAAADLYEQHYGELFALLHREAGKTLLDAVAELREAVDFLRYYAGQANEDPARGTFACISPWNFPLAIFTGQIAAALAAGNAVLAKPAEQTPLIGYRAAQLLIEAGVPAEALHLLPGAGDVGAALTSCPDVAGVAFTGSTETAQIIHKSMAENLAPGAPLIAETGGLNAMIVDSTALPEQAVQAIIESAFQSSGQRCSALRCLYVQEDIMTGFLEMLTGAMDALVLGDPWQPATDAGPVIDAEAAGIITDHIEAARHDKRLLHSLPVPSDGHFVPPALIRVDSIADMQREIFGPVLHIASFKGRDLDKVIDAINATGYGLTFGLQTRIDDRVQHVTDRIHAGNIYVNRNQIGAIVGSQPFGGEGLSGTGPKAGGPHYLPRFRAHPAPEVTPPNGDHMPATAQGLAQALVAAAKDAPKPSRTILPGPTGEANQLTTSARPPVLCLGPGTRAAQQQAEAIRALGGTAHAATGPVNADCLSKLDGFSGVVWWGDEDHARTLRRALAERKGPILPLITGMPDPAHALAERHICIDTTAAGGNTALLAGHA
ncbi:RHH-type proline utilization regulon transcriptional repressor/proline dehydrogenase/delta 1-pyrroline-5-carboxylate dehydrogenase [Sagittula marina]|uniref:Bifunctional protein PutA n=1 Tax=Sagittula marina TaxID=943940 RepID=A0A7W6DSE2_9RHOB|nr:bifunctional proline dehydrogenase/L-glutamate gamma-semialdehyde dehydrogenase PutA [Sagittula marina]MBB3987954.1 RHH-type proline utilization regulon transcriptional repressor/proline dehydrogenase/delta 1-pyrroline-5-carboxylate dehydrogenase [Sagittula marina]